jgi:hypothetical protein
MVTFGLFLTSNRVPILLSKKPTPKTRVQQTPCHNLSPLTPIVPHSTLCQPAAAPVASPAMPLPPAPTIITNNRCQPPLPTTTTPPMTASPHHHTGLIPMAQSPTRGGRVGTFSPTDNGRIDQELQPDSRLSRLAMSPMSTAVWQHRSDLSGAKRVGGWAWLQAVPAC